MRREHEGGLAVVAQAVEARGRDRIKLEVGEVERIAADDETVEMRELGRHASEVVPHAGEDLLDLVGRFVRERGRQVGPADAVLGPPGAYFARIARKHIADPDPVGMADRPEDQDDERPGRVSERGIRQGAETPAETSQLRFHLPPDRLIKSSR